MLLARWRFFVGAGGDEPTLTTLTIVARADQADAVRAGVERGRVTARAAALSRDLSNCPATTLSAERMGEVAQQVGAAGRPRRASCSTGSQLQEMGCGGILGVNRGSVEEPRLIKITYRPDSPSGHLGWSARGSCTTRAASASSRATSPTRR